MPQEFPPRLPGLKRAAEEPRSPSSEAHHQTKGSEACDFVFMPLDKVQMASDPGIRAPAAINLCGLSSAQTFIDHLWYARHYGHSRNQTHTVPALLRFTVYREGQADVQ